MKGDGTLLKTAQIDRLVSAGALAKDLMPSLPIGERTPPRCSGFLCSGNPIPPVPLAGAASVPRIDAWSRIGMSALARP